MIKLYTDASTKGNPGPSGAGIIIKSEDIYEQLSLPLDVMSNHEAEFTALIKGLAELEKIPSLSKEEMLFIYTDSQIVIDSIRKKYVKNPLFKPLLAEILNKLDDYALYFVEWTPDSIHKGADHLARQGLKKALK